MSYYRKVEWRLAWFYLWTRDGDLPVAAGQSQWLIYVSRDMTYNNTTLTEANYLIFVQDKDRLLNE